MAGPRRTSSILAARRGRWLALVLCLAVACGAATALAASPGKLPRSLRPGLRHAGPHPAAELALRLIDVEVELAALRVTYGGEHPRVRAALERRDRLRGQVASPAELPRGARADVCAGLKLRAFEAASADADMAREYRDAHPDRVKMKARIQALDELWRKAEAEGLCPRVPTTADLVVRLARAEGSLVWLESRFGPKHPEVVHARAEREQAKTALAKVGPLAPDERRAVAARLQAEAAALAAGSEGVTFTRDDFVADALLAAAVRVLAADGAP